jgi:hypothetical protein
LRVTTDLARIGNAISDPDVGDACSYGINDPCSLDPRDERELLGIKSGALINIDEV